MSKSGACRTNQSRATPSSRITKTYMRRCWSLVRANKRRKLVDDAKVVRKVGR